MIDSKLKKELPFYAMLIVPVIITLTYNYLPLIGLSVAFQDFSPSRHGFLYAIMHSKFVGLDVFKEIGNSPDTARVIFNTVFIASMEIVIKILVPLVFALLLNEVTSVWFKKAALTITYLPFFISWVVLGAILLNFFSPENGSFNSIIALFGLKPTFLFGSAGQFPFMVVITDLWQQIGYNTIIYLAALTSIDLTMYEAAIMDGAGRLKQTIFVTIPSIAPIVILVVILSMGNIVNLNFNQIFNLYSPAVYSSGDVIDTYAFRMGIQQGMFSIATAVGFFKSVVSFIMISISYFLASKFSNYKVI